MIPGAESQGISLNYPGSVAWVLGFLKAFPDDSDR
jgi:hypothetical protein